MTLPGQISQEIIGYGIVPVRARARGKVLSEGRGMGGPVAAGAGAVGFYEIMCRGPSKCGTFVSVRPLDACPKCGSSKVARRAGEPASKTKT